MTEDFVLSKMKSNAPVCVSHLCPVVSLEEQHEYAKSKYMACDRYVSMYT